jgi:methyl-galactoside transport system ATP-binding protein/inositol transport system ATP-binding protein
MQDNGGAREVSEYVLEMIDVSKSFPGVQALKNVSFRLRPGTVHALMGENGAGKSTLMKCLIGLYQMNSGKILINGKEVHISNPLEASKHGISMIHQELSPVTERSVAENLYLGRPPMKAKVFVDHKNLYRLAGKTLQGLGIDIDPYEKMGNLTVAKMQMVEIAKAVSQDASIIVMDEPTSSLTSIEVAQLFGMIKNLREKGVSVIFISHKMDEIFKICDDVTVFRDGQMVGTDLVSNMDVTKLIHLMVGRDLDEMFPKVECPITDVVMEVRDLSSGERFSGINFDLRRGEILGFAGLVGAGRTEVLEALFGLRTKTSGTIKIKGKTVNHRRITNDAREYIRKIEIKTPSKDALIQNLSGGNQQKVLVARWLLTGPDILFVDEPTRGIDVGAKAEIHSLITKMAGEGKAIIMVSSEMPEILGMCDRILVMHEGRQTGIIDRCDATQERIMEFATTTESDEIESNVI